MKSESWEWYVDISTGFLIESICTQSSHIVAQTSTECEAVDWSNGPFKNLSFFLILAGETAE